MGRFRSADPQQGQPSFRSTDPQQDQQLLYYKLNVCVVSLQHVMVSHTLSSMHVCVTIQQPAIAKIMIVKEELEELV